MGELCYLCYMVVEGVLLNHTKSTHIGLLVYIVSLSILKAASYLHPLSGLFLKMLPPSTSGWCLEGSDERSYYTRFRSTHLRHTVDGSDIRRSPVEVGSLSNYLQGLIFPGGDNRISQPSTVGLVFFQRTNTKKLPLSLSFSNFRSAAMFWTSY